MWILWATAAAAPDDTAAALVRSSLASDEPWAELEELCDDIGPRLSGSTNLDRAIAWAADKMREDGLDVRLQPVEVPAWRRGEAVGRIRGPVDEPLHLLALGMSVATPPDGLRAPVVVVRDLEALDALGEAVKGHVVVFDTPWQGYGATVAVRTHGADRASALGAVAVLVRSVTDTALALPHTGAVRYGEHPPIPAAAITPEAAARFRRWAERDQPVEVELRLGAEQGPDAPSANVIGEVRGRKRPREVVLLSCHLDSWDVGTGAQDNGAGCVAVMEAVAQIAALPRRPRRTVRAVLFTNEENGLRGGKAYAEQAGAEVHVAALETDTGMGGTLGLNVDPMGDDAAAQALLPAVRALLEPVADRGVDSVQVGYSGADIGPLLRARGGLGLGVLHDMSDYWAIHHTEADTIDKIDPEDLRLEVALLASLAWQLAELDEVPAVAEAK